MVDFHGWEMPIQYTGIVDEHQTVRTAVGMFDVSHMGQLRLVGADAAAALESLVPVDVLDLGVGRQRYAFFTNASGGLLDDLILVPLGVWLVIKLIPDYVLSDARDAAARLEVKPVSYVGLALIVALWLLAAWWLLRLLLPKI